MAIDDSDIINNIRIIPLARGYDLESFCCGNNDIDQFLKNSAITEQEEMLSRTYLAYFDYKVIGFFSLAAGSIEVLAIY